MCTAVNDIHCWTDAFCFLAQSAAREVQIWSLPASRCMLINVDTPPPNRRTACREGLSAVMVEDTAESSRLAHQPVSLCHRQNLAAWMYGHGM